MRLRIAVVAIALGCCVLGHAVCQMPDESPGQLLTIKTNVGSGYNCGRVSSPLYCYGIQATINGVPAGTFWLDTYISGTNDGDGGSSTGSMTLTFSYYCSSGGGGRGGGGTGWRFICGRDIEHNL